MLKRLKRYSKDEVAKERLRIIQFYKEHGEQTTKEAFGLDRKTVWVWKRRLEEERGKLTALIPLSTAPKNKRQLTVSPKVVEYIQFLREAHYRLGKEKIKPLLDRYCQKEGLPTISEATIGRVIKKKNFFHQKSGKPYHNPNHKFKDAKRKKRTRTKRPPKPGIPGYIEMDTILLFVDGVRRYVYSAIDVTSKFSFSLPYTTLTSKNTVDFFKKLERVIPFPIATVQTDNGLEFLGAFEQYLEKKKIIHMFIYPRCCKINGVVERYQRTLQEEFLIQYPLPFDFSKEFSDKLANYLLFYNTERVHKSLGNVSPIDYLISKGGMSKMSRSHTLAVLPHIRNTIFR